MTLCLGAALSPLAAFAGAPPILSDVTEAGGFDAKKVRNLGDDPLVAEMKVANRSRQAAFIGVIRIATQGDGLKRAVAKPDADAIGEAAAWGVFSDPPVRADVAALRFPDDDLEVLADCNVSDCKFKLSKEAIDKVDSIDWSKPDAGDRFDTYMQGEALLYQAAYLEHGNAALVVYADKSKPISLASTVTSIVSRFDAFEKYAPKFTAYLDSYPAGRPDGLIESYVWAIKDFGYRPTLSVDHVMVDETSEADGVLALIASKTIYANHYLAGRVQMGALVDGQVAFGVPGTFIVLVDRIDFDDELSGFKRSLLGRGLEGDMKSRMQLLRAVADR